MTDLTIIMPTYNSISRIGDGYLQQALESLLNQTYKDFKLHILDNISTDATFDVCDTYAAKDKRIILVSDTERRFPEGGINKLAEDVSTKYIMLANCDDLWNHHYIETLLPYLNSKKVDAVYSNGNFINMQNHISSTLIPDINAIYTDDPKRNFSIAAEYRSVIPILFGIFKTKAYKNSLPFKAFDNLKANVDNLFLLKFILNGNKIKFVNKDLFYYRTRHRKFEISAVEDMPESPILIWVYYTNHYLTFYNEINKILSNSVAKCILLDGIMRVIPTTIRFIVNDIETDPFEIQVMKTIYNRYQYIGELLLKDINMVESYELYNNTCKKIRLLKNYVMGYVKEIMMPNELIDEVINKLTIISKTFEAYKNEFVDKCN